MADYMEDQDQNRSAVAVPRGMAGIKAGVGFMRGPIGRAITPAGSEAGFTAMRSIGMPKVEYGDMPKFLQGASNRLAGDIASASAPKGANAYNMNMRERMRGEGGPPPPPRYPMSAFRKSPADAISDNVSDKLSQFTGMGMGPASSAQQWMQRRFEAPDMLPTDVYQGMMRNLMQQDPSMFQRPDRVITGSAGILSGKTPTMTLAGGGPSMMEQFMPAINMMMKAEGQRAGQLTDLFTGGYTPLMSEEARQKGSVLTAQEQSAGKRASAIPERNKAIYEQFAKLYGSPDIDISELPQRAQGFGEAISAYERSQQPQQQPQQAQFSPEDGVPIGDGMLEFRGQDGRVYRGSQEQIQRWMQNRARALASQGQGQYQY